MNTAATPARPYSQSYQQHLSAATPPTSAPTTTSNLSETPTTISSSATTPTSRTTPVEISSAAGVVKTATARADNIGSLSPSQIATSSGIPASSPASSSTQSTPTNSQQFRLNLTQTPMGETASSSTSTVAPTRMQAISPIRAAAAPIASSRVALDNNQQQYSGAHSHLSSAAYYESSSVNQTTATSNAASYTEQHQDYYSGVNVQQQQQQDPLQMHSSLAIHHQAASQHPHRAIDAFHQPTQTNHHQLIDTTSQQQAACWPHNLTGGPPHLSNSTSPRLSSTSPAAHLFNQQHVSPAESESAPANSSSSPSTNGLVVQAPQAIQYNPSSYMANGYHSHPHHAHQHNSSSLPTHLQAHQHHHQHQHHHHQQQQQHLQIQHHHPHHAHPNPHPHHPHHPFQHSQQHYMATNHQQIGNSATQATSPTMLPYVSAHQPANHHHQQQQQQHPHHAHSQHNQHQNQPMALHHPQPMMKIDPDYAMHLPSSQLHNPSGLNHGRTQAPQHRLATSIANQYNQQQQAIPMALSPASSSGLGNSLASAGSIISLKTTPSPVHLSSNHQANQVNTQPMRYFSPNIASGPIPLNASNNNHHSNSNNIKSSLDMNHPTTSDNSQASMKTKATSNNPQLGSTASSTTPETSQSLQSSPVDQMHLECNAALLKLELNNNSSEGNNGTTATNTAALNPSADATGLNTNTNNGGGVGNNSNSNNSNNSSAGNTTGRSKRLRTSFKHNQLKEMKKWFARNQNPDAKDLKMLAQATQLSKRVLQVWFQNARAKYRRNNARQLLNANQHMLQFQQHHHQQAQQQQQQQQHQPHQLYHSVGSQLDHHPLDVVDQHHGAPNHIFRG